MPKKNDQNKIYVELDHGSYVRLMRVYGDDLFYLFISTIISIFFLDAFHLIHQRSFFRVKCKCQILF